MKKKTPSSIRSKHKKYESLEVDNITLEEHEIESYMEEITLNSPNKHNNNKNNHDSNSSMTAKKIHCGRFLGLFMMFLSAAFFLSMSTMISYLGRTNPDNLYPSTQLVFIRAIVCLILSAMWLRKEKESFLPEDTRTRNLLIYRSCIGVGGMLGNWFLISQLPFSDATVIVFSAPFWTMVMARLILNESFTKIDAVSLALGFLGVLLVARPGSSHETEEETPSGTARGIVVLIGICGAICSAGTNLLVRRLKHVHAMLTIFYLMIAASFGSIALAVINQDKFIFPANPTESILIIFISLFGFIGQLFKTEGLKRENAGPGAMMRLLDPMMSPFIQYFLFKEALHPSSIFGVIVIFFAGVLVGIKKIYFDPTNDVNMNELVSVREIIQGDGEDEDDSNDRVINVKYTTDKVTKFNDNGDDEDEVEIDLENSLQQKVAWE